jgi:hypothetical protein
MDVQKAADDVRRRTLARLPKPLAKFIYLASMRDYNTGLYYHDGLADRFSPEVACEALADCHREAFHHLLMCSVESLVDQLQSYLASSKAQSDQFIASWKGIAAYRVLAPIATDPFAAEFLFSNLKIALAIVEERLERSHSLAQAS